MGIFHRGNGTVNITGQAIGTACRTPDELRSRVRAAREAAAEGTGTASTGIRNTGTGSITITGTAVNGEYIEDQTL